MIFLNQEPGVVLVKITIMIRVLNYVQSATIVAKLALLMPQILIV